MQIHRGLNFSFYTYILLTKGLLDCLPNMPARSSYDYSFVLMIFFNLQDILEQWMPAVQPRKIDKFLKPISVQYYWVECILKNHTFLNTGKLPL